PFSVGILSVVMRFAHLEPTVMGIVKVDRRQAVEHILIDFFRNFGSGRNILPTVRPVIMGDYVVFLPSGNI
ncbi:MAG: hypothetical protein IJN11_10460, partial [Oscillospiraceae bacterium]|nr:hypothetical protein [Oscillospiraceae bacterium]